MRSHSLLLAASFLSAFAGMAQTLTTAQAREHDGDRVTICGTVKNEHTAEASKGKPTFIDMDSSFPEPVFVVVVWDEDKPQVGALPPLKAHLCATGTINYYRGVPQMVVKNRSQISY
jgi:hypothetical protein